MMKDYTLIGLVLFIGLVLVTTGCTKDDDEDPAPENETGNVILHFSHVNNGEPLLFDTLAYENEAGNPYLVNEIQYFISDVTLHRDDGAKVMIHEWKDMHYVDSDIEETHTWEVYDDIPAGSYEAISFVFGITGEKNQSFMFVNPPERDMFWPEFLGGGYHYLKLNGKWIPEGQSIALPFDFHLGIGQEYHSYPDSITGFIHNHFEVSLTGSDFQISDGERLNFTIVMHVENWFSDPHVYDHDVWGGYIMQNQEAMQIVKENGWNVFTFVKNEP